MPSTKGPFTFPAPYGTRGARITDSTDRGGNNDVVYKPGYSYWPAINYHGAGDPEIKILVSFSDSNGLRIFKYNKTTEAVTNVGPAIDPGRAYSGIVDEHIYWSQSHPDKFYVIYLGKLIRYNHETDTEEVVIDLATHASAPAGADTMWQPNSSRDDTVHSFTVRQGSTPLGAASYNETTDTLTYHAAVGQFDECQISRDGGYLIVKQDENSSGGEDVRLHRLSDNATWLYDDQIDGAPGHSDNGDGFMIGADNWSVNQAGDDNVWKLWDLSQGGSIVPVTQYYNDDSLIEAPSHCSANAVFPGGITDQIVCMSSSNAINTPHANEIFFVKMDGSRRVLIGCPSMTQTTTGGDGLGNTTGTILYYRRGKASWDHTGRYCIFGSNLMGDYMDIFLLKVPYELLND